MDRIEAFLADVLALAGEEPDVIGDLLDGFVLTALVCVAIGTTYYGIRVVKELRHFARK